MVVNTFEEFAIATGQLLNKMWNSIYKYCGHFKATWGAYAFDLARPCGNLDTL